MDISKDMWKISSELEDINNLGNYSVKDFIDALSHKVSQIHFFYNTIMKQANNDENKAIYHLKNEPKEHQTIYVALGRGYPKELHDWHFCYVFRKIGIKYLVVPVTSIKEDSPEANPEFEMDIDVVNNDRCRMHLDETRVIDIMRINERRGYFDVATSRKDINNFFAKLLDKNEEE